MGIRQPKDIIEEYYEGLCTPVFLCGRRSIKWYNTAAEELSEEKALCSYLNRLTKPEKEETEVFTCDEWRYRISLRPCSSGFYVEVSDRQSFGTFIEPAVCIDGAEAIDNTVRKSSHQIFQSIASLNETLELIERYDELKKLDTIADGTYRILRAANLYYEYNLLLQDKMQPESTDVFGEIETLCSSIQSIMRKSDIPFNCSVPEEKLVCNLDMHKLSFALFHLICNSYYFTAPGNEIKVTAAHVSGDHLQIRVYDKGMGIKAGNLERIVEPFYSHDPTTGDISGCGLGLTYAHLLAQKKGGTCTVASSKRQTVVSLSIPITPLSYGSNLVSGVAAYSVGKYDPMVATMSTLRSRAGAGL